MSKLSVVTALLSVCGVLSDSAGEAFEAQLHGQSSNVIMLMFDDLGRNDLGSFGAEWETPNIDQFLRDSVLLSHHYIGYVCSASRSQFLTGRYSFHNGYGTLNVFDIEKLGAMPLSTPTFVEYLKAFGNYDTYAIGKWQLGNPTFSNMATNRGFDRFWGFNGGMEDYRTKTHEILGSEFRDFFEGTSPTGEWDGDYSTDQFVSKAMEVVGQYGQKAHEEGDSAELNPFFIYVGFQAIHFPFAEDTSYYKVCQETVLNKIDLDSNEDRMGVCESVLGVDYQLGLLLEYFQSTEELKAVWENTLVILTSDNGGDIDEGSCNYPLRGGKNTFFEGGQRVIAAVGGGVIPDEQRGVILDGLMSNVDWFPTILAFANLIPTNSKHVLFGDQDHVAKITSESMRAELEVSDTAMVLDGYNMYEYIMDPANEGIRDHVLLHAHPKSESDDDFDNGDPSALIKDINEYELEDFREIALIFFDADGSLWKYFDVSKSENPIGNPGINSGWCVTDDGEEPAGAYKLEMDDSLDEDYLKVGLFDLTHDLNEVDNLLVDLNDQDFEGDTESTMPGELYEVVLDKLAYYVNNGKNGGGSLNSNTMYGDFKCFTLDETDTVSTAAIAVGTEHNAWMPFYTVDEWREQITSLCGLGETHPIYKLFNNELVLPSSLESTDNTEQVDKLNSNVPPATARRRFDELQTKWSIDNENDQDVTVKQGTSAYHGSGSVGGGGRGVQQRPQEFRPEFGQDKLSLSGDTVTVGHQSEQSTLHTMAFAIVALVMILMGIGVMLYQRFGGKTEALLKKAVRENTSNYGGEYTSLS